MRMASSSSQGSWLAVGLHLVSVVSETLRQPVWKCEPSLPRRSERPLTAPLASISCLLPRTVSGR